MGGQIHRRDVLVGLIAGLVGALVGAILVSTRPADATAGDTLQVGRKNYTNARTWVIGAGDTVFLNTTPGGEPAATFLVKDGAPFAVNSTEKVTNLNADLLDGFDRTDFVPVGQACTEEGSSVVGIDANGTLQCLVGGATTTTTTTTLGICSIDDDCPVCQVCTGESCENAAILTDPKSECGPYFCTGTGTCASACAANAECKDNFHCDQGDCVPDPLP